MAMISRDAPKGFDPPMHMPPKPIVVDEEAEDDNDLEDNSPSD